MVTRIDKAIIAGLGAGSTAAVAFHGDLGGTNLIVIAVAAVVVGVITFLVPNKAAA